jgi:hypothetical protein
MGNDIIDNGPTILLSFLNTCMLQLSYIRIYLEQLQQFGKSTWHPSDFGKIKKIGLQQFGKNRNSAKLTSPRVYMRARIVVSIVVSL